MKEAVSIGMIGDYAPVGLLHGAVIAALGHAADYLSIKLDIDWLPAESLLEPEYQSIMEDKGMRVTGLGENGEARIVELSDHRFFMATAFQPHFSSETGWPHPLILAFLEAASSFGNMQG